MDIIGGLDNFISGGSVKKGDQALDRARQRFDEIEVPTLEEMRIQLAEAVNAGEMTPEDAETFFLEQTAQENVSTDPRLREAQMNALSSLQDVSQGGLTAGDRGDLQRIQGESQAAEKGQRDAILQNAQARGVSGSGMELASQMMAQQGAASRASQQGFDVAKQAQNRALEAMMAGGQMSGQMRGQDFGEQSKLAEARDAISRFNTQNQQAVNVGNIGARNTATLRNVNTAQDVANRGQDTTNQQLGYNAQNVKDQYSQRMQKVTGQAGVDQAQATAAQEDAKRKTGLLGTLASAGASAYNRP